MKDVGVEIDVVRPAKGASNRVDGCVGECLVVVDRRENPGEFTGEIELPHEAIGERNAERAAAKMLDIGDSGQRHVYRLLERLDPGQSGRLLGERPVHEEFVVMQASPLLDEAHRRFRELTTDRRPVVNADQCLVLGVDRMEVWRIVISEVHVDHDPVELAQPWHSNNLGRKARPQTRGR